MSPHSWASGGDTTENSFEAQWEVKSVLKSGDEAKPEEKSAEEEKKESVGVDGVEEEVKKDNGGSREKYVRQKVKKEKDLN